MLSEQDVLRALGEAVQTALSVTVKPGLLTEARIGADGGLVIGVKDDGAIRQARVTVEPLECYTPRRTVVEDLKAVEDAKFCDAAGTPSVEDTDPQEGTTEDADRPETPDASPDAAEDGPAGDEDVNTAEAPA